MTKTLKTVLPVIGALTGLAAILILIKKKFCKCKKCENCGCDDPETVEDFVEEATEEPKPEEPKPEEPKPEEPSPEAVAEEFKDYADVELPKPEN